MKRMILGLMILFSVSLSAQQITDSVYIGDFIEPEPSRLYDNSELTPCRELRVVVHVVFDSMDGFGSTQIREDQVHSQIRATNQYFRNDSMFYDPENAGLEYTIKLAEMDPDGLPTNGIIYHDGVELFGEAWHTYGLRNSNQNAVSQSVLAQEVGWGADINGKKYINSYVVPKIDGNSGGGVQAFAYFPTTNVVFGNYNLYNTFGSYLFLDEYGGSFALKSYTNEGKVWSHELLHNGAIFHTFQGNSCEPEVNSLAQGDRVADTPPQTQGLSCVGSCGFLSRNLMDYLSETCKDVITQGQSDRFSLVVANSLQDYLVCSECQPILNGDFNGDGFTNILDLSFFGTSFGCQQGDDCYQSIYDMNCDGVINVTDLSLIQNVWGTSTRGRADPVDLLGRQINPNNTGIQLENSQKKFIYRD